MRGAPGRILSYAWGVWLAMVASSADAGWYAMPQGVWSIYSARPLASEDTANLYGVGGQLSLGYSFYQKVDFGLFGQYLPGTPEHTQVGIGDASLVSYGGEIGLRFGDAVYLGIAGGQSRYRLRRQSVASELDAALTGVGGAVTIAGVSKVSKSAFAQAGLLLMHHAFAAPADGSMPARQFDGIGLGLGYMWNSRGGQVESIQTTIFKDFLNSIIF